MRNKVIVFVMLFSLSIFADDSIQEQIRKMQEQAKAAQEQAIEQTKKATQSQEKVIDQSFQAGQKRIDAETAQRKKREEEARKAEIARQEKLSKDAHKKTSYSTEKVLTKQEKAEQMRKMFADQEAARIKKQNERKQMRLKEQAKVAKNTEEDDGIIIVTYPSKQYGKGPLKECYYRGNYYIERKGSVVASERITGSGEAKTYKEAANQAYSEVQSVTSDKISRYAAAGDKVTMVMHRITGPCAVHDIVKTGLKRTYIRKKKKRAKVRVKGKGFIGNRFRIQGK